MDKPIEIKLKRKIFTSALEKTSLALPSGKATFPFLNQVLLEYNQEKIILTATDLKKIISTTINYNCENQGAILFPGKLVLDILRKLTEEEVTFILTNNQLILKTIKSSFSFQLIAADEYPAVPQTEAGQELKVSQVVLSSILKQGLYSASRDMEREGLSGALLSNTNGLIRAVTTDGHRLSYGEGELINFASKNLQVMVSATDLKLVEQLNSGEDIIMKWDQKQVEFNQDNIRMTFKLLGAKFPPYEEVIPRQCSTIVKIKTQPLMQSIDRLTSLNQQEPVKMVLGDTISIGLSAAGVGEGLELVETEEFKGTKLEIAISPRYLTESLKNCGNDSLYFGFNSSSSPITISNHRIPKAEEITGGYYLALIMPIQR